MNQIGAHEIQAAIDARKEKRKPPVAIPARRFYFLTASWIAIGPLVALLFGLQTGIVMTLVFNTIVCGLAYWDAWQAQSHAVRIARTPLEHLSVGRDNLVELTVEAGDRFAPVRIRDGYPHEFAVSTPEFQLRIEAHRMQTLVYSVKPHRRGEFTWTDIRMRQLGPLGLAWRDWSIPAQQTVSVYPDLLALRSLSIRLALDSTGTLRRRRLGTGTEFAELREYRRGDDTRAIDWKATARRSRPIVRVLEPEKEQTLIVLIDSGRLMTARVEGLQRFDWAVNSALALAMAAIHRGDRVGIGAFARDVTTWIPPERGQPHLNQLIEKIAPLQPVRHEPDYFSAISRLVTQQHRRALVVLLTDIVDRIASAELLTAMLCLVPRYLPFCVALRDPQIDAIAAQPTLDTTAACERAVALDLIAQRQTAFAPLRQKGVSILDEPASRISDRLVESYLQLKAKSLL
ncbi:hypothetical protein KR51_00004350 [Rubidibacter lacunae KORDI 51-2]|uniref:VWFA domain-containing protein n=1 Tax=Rubidibacter lacunae KORDI 51-2 TaxID=582515 RepID=U5DPM1_9CHRO|nr:DUF58 domain-containing protein [Rubidibacter lacunae]ERN42817.1 hypothetical protein KR51_00004350 [Rubidibacter lacunae KORDI 51-2]